MSVIEVRDCRSGAEVLANARDVKRRIAESEQARERNRIKAKRDMLSALFLREWKMVRAAEHQPPAVPLDPLHAWHGSAGAGPVPFNNTPSLDAIRDATCAYYGITKMDFVSDRRWQRLVRPRHVFCYLARKHTPCSYPVIGRAVGKRDHTTILHGVRAAERLVAAADVNTLAAISEIESMLGLRNATPPT